MSHPHGPKDLRPGDLVEFRQGDYVVYDDMNVTNHASPIGATGLVTSRVQKSLRGESMVRVFTGDGAHGWIEVWTVARKID